MKISIKFSILSILLALLLGTSLCIVGINYFILNKILIQTTRDSISHASGKISEQVARYLQPLDLRSHIGASLIDEEIIVPAPSTVFVRFLSRIIVDQKNLTAAYWADAEGNLYFLERTDGGHFSNKNIVVANGNRKVLENNYDLDMNLLDSKEISDAGLNPLIRPWYQLAKFKKQYTWLIYPMVDIKSAKHIGLGITAAYPIYDQNNKLRGIFGIDIPLNVISTFVKSIQLTKNSIILICNNEGDLYSAYSTTESLLQDYRMPSVADLGIGWVTLSFDIYSKQHESIFIFNYAGKKYIAAYEKILDLRGGPDSYVAIVTPVQDVIAPLQRNIMVSFALIALALIGCVFFAAVFSARISKPIVKLTQDAELICQLRLEEVQQLFSRIKEIDYMARSFIKMKNALRSFQRYMPVALVKNLVLSGKVAEVGGEMKETTLLFCDIEDFTKISENMQPPEVMHYLSDYFQVLAKAIIGTGGIVDKYIGDGLMAFWGAPIDDPEHAIHACHAALQIDSILGALNEKRRSENKLQIHTRIGINTSQVIVGNVGSDDRLSYTALGDGVNLTSRLEGLNKEYGTYTIVGENTYHMVKEHFKFRFIDKVAVKGKVHGIRVYELLGENTGTKDQQAEQYNQDFQIAFGLYEKREWQQACDLFFELARKNEQDLLPKIFIGRCQKLLNDPPLHWDGTWIMDHK